MYESSNSSKMNCIIFTSHFNFYLKNTLLLYYVHDYIVYIRFKYWFVEYKHHQRFTIIFKKIISAVSQLFPQYLLILKCIFLSLVFIYNHLYLWKFPTNKVDMLYTFKQKFNLLGIQDLAVRYNIII